MKEELDELKKQHELLKKYTEYLAQNLNEQINYAEYLAEKMNVLFTIVEERTGKLQTEDSIVLNPDYKPKKFIKNIKSEDFGDYYNNLLNDLKE